MVNNGYIDPGLNGGFNHERHDEDGRHSEGFTHDFHDEDGDEQSRTRGGRVSLTRITADIGRRVRWLTGVREDLLDQVPSERARYNGLAWTMIGTASLAAVGMAILISQISDASIVTSIVAASGWGVFILGIDYLVVSHIDDKKVMRHIYPLVDDDRVAEGGGEKNTTARNRTIVRLVLATFLGLTVGESLVLAAFSSAANDSLNVDERARLQQELCDVNGELVVYRPDLRVPGCGSFVAAPAGSPAAGSPATSTATTQVEPTRDESAVPPTATPGPSTAPTLPKPDLSVYDTADLQAQLQEAESKIQYYVEAATCEDVPRGFSEERRTFLLCSGQGGQGRNWREKIAQKDHWTAERDRIQGLVAAADEARRGAQAEYDKANAQLAAKFEAQKAEETAAARQRAELDAESKRQIADAAAVAAQAEEEAAAALRDERANSPAAVLLAQRQLDTQQRLQDLAAGDVKYGLNERFEATEQTVDPRIKWALRLLFVLVDMTPILLKMTLEPSTVEKMVVMERRGVLYPHVTRLKKIEDDFMADELAEMTRRSPARAPSLAGATLATWSDPG